MNDTMSTFREKPARKHAHNTLHRQSMDHGVLNFAVAQMASQISEESTDSNSLKRNTPIFNDYATQDKIKIVKPQ